MVFRRYARSGFRKGRRLYKWGRKNPKQALAMARSAYRGVRILRGLVNSEMFHLDQTMALGNNSNVIHYIPNISQGDGVGHRTGNSILAKSFNFNGYMSIHPDVISNTRISLALVLDKQQISDTAPALSDIFQNPADPHTLLNVAHVGRFSILWRQQYTLSPSTGGKDAMQLKKFFKMSRHIRFNGTAGTDLQKSGLYLCILTSEGTNYPTISFYTRLNYHDN